MNLTNSMDNINEHSQAILAHWFGQNEDGELIIKSKAFQEVYTALAEYKAIDLDDKEQQQAFVIYIEDIVIRAFKGLEFTLEEWATLKKIAVDLGDVSLAKTISVLVLGAVADIPLTHETVTEINKQA